MGVLTMALFIATRECSLFGALFLVPYFTENSFGKPRFVCNLLWFYSYCTLTEHNHSCH